MCKEVNEKNATARNHETAPPRRLARLVALDRLDEKADGVRQIRQTFEAIREQHERSTKELAEAEDLIEKMEDEIMDEAMAIAAFYTEGEDDGDADHDEEDDDEDDGDEDDANDDPECECGCQGGSPLDYANGYDDEEIDRIRRLVAVAHEPLKQQKRPGLAPVVFGALGVACAVASLVSQSLADKRKR